MDTLSTALYWLQLGIAVVPLAWKSKTPVVAWKAHQTVLPTEAQVRHWFGAGPRNLAIVTGWQDLVVLDFDSMDAYSVWAQWASEALAAQVTYRVLTRRGVHVYVAITEPVHSFKLSGVVEVRSKGQYVAAPPSVHPSGAVYMAANPSAPIVRVETLAEILPEAWIAPAPLLSSARPPVPVLASDVWGCATGDKVARAKQHRIEAWFRQAQPSGEGWLLDWCPFHDDRRAGGTPSLWINTHKQLCGCYSPRCSASTKPMDVINVFARLNGVSNAEAIRQLAR